MAEYEKFLFDNFVIEDKDELPPLPEDLSAPSTDTALIIPEGADISEADVEIKPDSTEGKDSEEIEPETTEETEEIALEEETLPEPQEELKEEDDELPIVITYTEEEVAERVEQAKKEAYNKGITDAANSSQAQIQHLLTEIDKLLQEKLSEMSTIKEELSKGFRSMGISLLETLVPSLIKEQAVELLNNFLRQNFENFVKEPKLTFYFNPEILVKTQEMLGALAHKNDYEGKIVLHKDQNLAISECRIEWENGGVEYNTTQMLETAKALIKEGE